MVKGRVEYGYVRHSGEQFPHLADAGDDHRIMQRRERIQLFHFRNELIGEERGFGEFLAAVNNAMGHDTHFTGAADNSCLLRSELRNHRLEGRRVISFFQIAL